MNIWREVRVYNLWRKLIKLPSKAQWGPMLKDGKFVFDLSPKACRAACEGSLKRLGIECVTSYERLSKML